MVHKRTALVALAIALLAGALCGPSNAQVTHMCDPVDPIADAGWSVVPSLEIVGVVDSPPYQTGSSGNWFVERTTTRIPFCNYYNEIGIYSMRSYTLEPEVTKDQIRICEGTATGGTVAVLPHDGPCPPR